MTVPVCLVFFFFFFFLGGGGGGVVVSLDTIQYTANGDYIIDLVVCPLVYMFPAFVKGPLRECLVWLS